MHALPKYMYTAYMYVHVGGCFDNILYLNMNIYLVT